MNGFDADIIVVGGGPCGLVLAGELGRRGIATTLFNDRTGTSPDPQANATQARTMEHFRRLGLAGEIRDLGLPPDYPTDIAYYTRYSQYELARFQQPSSNQAKALIKHMTGSWSAAELPHRVSQMLVEQVLRRHAAQCPSVQLNFGWRVTEVADHGDHVTATAEGDGQRRRLRARYLVGCDGPRSLVRRHLGIDYAGSSGVVRDFMGGRMHAIYLRSPQMYGRINGAKAWMNWTFNGDRRSFMAAIDGEAEFVFHTQLHAGEEDGGDISEAKARAMFTETMGCPIDFDILSRKSWTAGFALVAERLRAGRLFIAGDAAHLFTPTGGLGYNTAIEDAVNLGWKLAAVTGGWGGAGLLDSYELERRPNALRNTGYARGFADSIGGYRAPPALEDDSHEGAAARAEAGAYLEAHARAEFNIPGITFGYRYDGSPIIAPDASRPPPDQANTYLPTACPGGRAPHAWLADGASLYDRFGFEFTLLRLAAAQDTAPDTAALEKAAAARGLPLAVVDAGGETLASGDTLRGLYQANLALIRPDQMVAWRGDTLPDDPAALLARVSGG